MPDHHDHHRGPLAVLVTGVLLLALSACSGDGESGTAAESPPGVDPVVTAERLVTSREEALAAAEADQAAAVADFCVAAEDYVTAIDRYGDVLHATEPTVGDVTDAGSDLEQPAQDAQEAAGAVDEGRQAVSVAEQELAEAQAELATAQAAADGATPPPRRRGRARAPPRRDPGGRHPRAGGAGRARRRAGGHHRPDAPGRGGRAVQRAAVALEMAWLRLLGDSGCLTDAEQAEAVEAASTYTATLQQALADAGYYDADVDGIYGPRTVAAVEALQEANGLPQTGTLDKATEQALRTELEAQGDAAAQEVDRVHRRAAADADPARLLGRTRRRPVERRAHDAVERLQTDLGAPVTGAVDAATVAAVQGALTEALAPAATPSPTESAVATPQPTASG